MEKAIGRPVIAHIYAWGVALAALVVIVQGIMFGGFYSGRGDLLEVHEWLGAISGYVVLVILTPLGFLARWPRGWQIGWLTLVLGVLWNIQAHVLGFGIEDERSLQMVHIPVAFLIFGLALYLAGKTLRALVGRSD